MSYKERKLTKNDIYSLYEFYWSYKQYYDFYWTHQEANNITKEDIDKKIKNIIEQHSALEGPIEALCYYARIPKSELFNKDGSPKDINELDTLKMIKEANYGEIND